MKYRGYDGLGIWTGQEKRLIHIEYRSRKAHLENKEGYRGLTLSCLLGMKVVVTGGG
jgi:hypothetical protein